MKQSLSESENFAQLLVATNQRPGGWLQKVRGKLSEVERAKIGQLFEGSEVDLLAIYSLTAEDTYCHAKLKPLYEAIDAGEQVAVNDHTKVLGRWHSAYRAAGLSEDDLEAFDAKLLEAYGGRVAVKEVFEQTHAKILPHVIHANERAVPMAEFAKIDNIELPDSDKYLYGLPHQPVSNQWIEEHILEGRNVLTHRDKALDNKLEVTLEADGGAKVVIDRALLKDHLLEYGNAESEMYVKLSNNFERRAKERQLATRILQAQDTPAHHSPDNSSAKDAELDSNEI